MSKVANLFLRPKPQKVAPQAAPPQSVVVVDDGKNKVQLTVAPSEPEEKQNLGKGFGWNLVCYIMIAALISVWTYRYTDSFDLVVQLVGFSSFFSLIAFVTRLIPESQSKYLLKALYVFLWRIKPGCLWGLFFLILITTLCVGTIEITTDDLASGGPLKYERIGTGSEDSLYLTKGQSTRLLFYTNPFDHSVVRIKPFGYPDGEFEMKPWRIAKAHIPEAFQRPVLILRPNPELYLQASRNTFTNLKLLCNNKVCGTIEKYNGEAIWLSYNDEVEVPAEILDRWKFDIVGRPGDSEYHIIALKHPIAFKRVGDTPILAGKNSAKYTLLVTNHSNKEYAPCGEIEWPPPDTYPHVESVFWVNMTENKQTETQP